MEMGHDSTGMGGVDSINQKFFDKGDHGSISQRSVLGTRAVPNRIHLDCEASSTK